MLKREDLTEERVEMLIKEARKFGPFEALSRDEREANRQNFLDARPNTDDQGLWVFGYGSLLWNPAFLYTEDVPARLYGYRRRFCLHLTMGRGSPEKPSLMLALDTSGSCNRHAFYVTPDQVDSETTILWRREMMSGAYQPKWITLYLEGGRKVTGMTFVVNKEHSRYIQHLEEDEVVRRLSHGEGHLGTSREYLENTVAHLEESQVKDVYLHRLCRKLQEKYPL